MCRVGTGSVKRMWGNAMKLGCCANIEKADVVHRAGYDFIECPVVSLQPETSDSHFQEKILPLYRGSPVPTEAFNVFLSRDLKVVGPAVDWNRLQAYVERALHRVKQIGAEIVVFGSGGARTAPDGFSKEHAEEQILEFLHMVADYAEPLGITIVIEPLNRKECNMINHVPEAVTFAERVNRESIRVLADFYHMEEEQESLAHVATHGRIIHHIHVADSGRGAPGTGKYPYEAFVSQVALANYDRRISVECKWRDFVAEAEVARAFLARQFGE